MAPDLHGQGRHLISQIQGLVEEQLKDEADLKNPENRDIYDNLIQLFLKVMLTPFPSNYCKEVSSCDIVVGVVSLHNFSFQYRFKKCNF